MTAYQRNLWLILAREVKGLTIEKFAEAYLKCDQLKKYRDGLEERLFRMHLILADMGIGQRACDCPEFVEKQRKYDAIEDAKKEEERLRSKKTFEQIEHRRKQQSEYRKGEHYIAWLTQYRQKAQYKEDKKNLNRSERHDLL